MTPAGVMAAGPRRTDPEGMTTTALNVPVPQAWIRRLGRDTLYLTFGLATSILALAVWISGVTVTLSLAVFIIGLPVALVTAIVFRWTVELDRQNAALVFGAPVKARYRDHSGPILVRLSRTFRDPQTWKDLAWLITHSVVGMAFGIVAVALVGYTLGAATLPLWYWSIPDGVEFGVLNVDTLPEALGVMLLAAPLAVTLGRAGAADGAGAQPPGAAHARVSDFSSAPHGSLIARGHLSLRQGNPEQLEAEMAHRSFKGISAAARLSGGKSNSDTNSGRRRRRRRRRRRNRRSRSSNS